MNYLIVFLWALLSTTPVWANDAGAAGCPEGMRCVITDWDHSGPDLVFTPNQIGPHPDSRLLWCNAAMEAAMRVMEPYLMKRKDDMPQDEQDDYLIGKLGALLEWASVKHECWRAE